MSERCPVCALDLVDGDPGQRGCPRCKGTWLDTTAFAQLVHQLSGAAPDITVVEPRGARPCPVCGAVMGAGTIFDVLVDRCPEHGVWTDAGEVSRMVLAARRAMLGK